MIPNNHLKIILDNEKEWRLHLVSELSVIKKKQTDISNDIEGLKVKSGLWGVIGGALPVILGMGAYILRGLSWSK